MKTNVEESTRNEQKALADCRTLQKVVKEMGSLESALKQKDSKIKSLEEEVRVCLHVRTNILCPSVSNSHFPLSSQSDSFGTAGKVA